MKGKYELVIFDLDGTLLDTSEGILSATRYAAKTVGARENAPANSPVKPIH